MTILDIPAVQTLATTAYGLGLKRDQRIDANAMIEDIAAAVIDADGMDHYDGSPVTVDEFVIAQVVVIAQAYFDGLSVSYGLEPGEIIVHEA